MGLDKVWIQTLSDGLLRADQVVGLTSHATPSLPGKAARWLLDATVAVAAGSGAAAGGWDVGILHRTLAQTAEEPTDAPEALARVLARLDQPGTAGIITPSATRHGVEFSFSSFAEAPAEPGSAAEATERTG
ncbi:hypothetical protein [Amycolatopsis sp. GA6-003]|uniref:hypothetical protein n=1 Tax=Amycolatopsis sp. GA6-003 TaxID=2652444 RepID=UPI00391754E9